MGAVKIRSEDIFQALTNSEIEFALDYVFNNSVPMVGKCDDNSIIIVKPKTEGSSPSEIFGLLKTTSRVKWPQEVIFSFVVNENKYLLKATFSVVYGKTVSIVPTTRLFCIQRRSNERLKIPDEYYALFKFTHINGRPIRSFGKIKNMSAGGVGIVLRNDTPKILKGDVIRGVITLSCRPPEDVELHVKHTRPDKDGEINLQVFGGAFVPENSSLLKRRMTSVITDIYRDIFKNINVKKS